VQPNGEFYDGAVFYKEAERVAKLKLNQNSSRASGWVPVGPDQRASSSLTKGMGRINCIAFHPTDANTFWVGVAQGGVWKTTNSGSTWTPLTDDLPILRISDIAIDPVDPDIIYICVGDYGYIDIALDLDDRKRHSHYGLGVYKSIDGGANWSATGLTYQLTELDGSLMRRVLIDPNNTSNLVAAGVSGIWTSSDAGSTWLQTQDSLIWDIEIDPNNSNVVYASTGHLKEQQWGSAGIMKSTDFGSTWTLLSTGIPPTGAVQRVELAIAPTNSNHLYAIACDYNEGLYGVYSSLNAGSTWSLVNSGQTNILEWYDGTGAGGQGTYDLSILVDPTNENKIYTGGVNIWGSADGGATFDAVSLWYDSYGPGLHADQHQFKYNPLDNKFYVCNDGGLVRTSQILIGSWNDANNFPNYQWPTTWEYVSDGMQTNSFYAVGISEGNSGNFSAGAQDNATYFNNNSNWSNLFGGDGMHTMLHPTDPNTIYGSSQYGRILYSTNGGSNLSHMFKPPGEDGEWVTPFMFAPSTTNQIYGGFGNLHVASPGSSFNNPLTSFADMPGASVPAPISQFNISESDPDHIYIAKRIYHSYNQLSELWVTGDGGLTWTNRTSGLPDSSYFTSVEVDNDDPLNAWVVVAGFEAGKHVYHTTDGGITWQNETFDLPNLPTNCIIHRDESIYNTVYVATDIGVYYSNDTLNSWIAYNQNLPNVIVSDLEIHYSDEKLYAATFGRGVWTSDLIIEMDSTTDSTNTALIPDIYNMGIDIFPNPNNGQFTLRINQASAGQLLMEVIDIMGKSVYQEKVRIQAMEFQNNYDLHLTSGMYFLKVSSGNRMRSLRFIVE
jgi:photosystem II stability/assembly factor-like uncharacterized protein